MININRKPEIKSPHGECPFYPDGVGFVIRAVRKYKGNILYRFWDWVTRTVDTIPIEHKFVVGDTHALFEVEFDGMNNFNIPIVYFRQLYQHDNESYTWHSLNENYSNIQIYDTSIESARDSIDRKLGM